MGLAGWEKEDSPMVAQIVSLPRLARKKPISVIMVSYMTGPALVEAIHAVLDDKDIHELIIVDNGNTESARARLSRFLVTRNRVRFIQGHGNIGFARGCNYGASLATGHYLLFLNPDAIISPGAARRLADSAEGLNNPWLAGGLLRDVEGKEQRGSRRGALTPISAFLSFTGLHKLPGLKSIHKDTEPMPAEPTAVETVSGAFMMMDRASFEAVGGFDENYFLHVEDIDICRRTRQAGGDVLFVPSASVMHYGSTSKVSPMVVELEKMKGFIYYFWNYRPGFLSKFLTTLAAPFMAMALMGRAAYLSLRVAIIGR